jgi:hypothetical protein
MFVIILSNYTPHKLKIQQYCCSRFPALLFALAKVKVHFRYKAVDDQLHVDYRRQVNYKYRFVLTGSKSGVVWICITPAAVDCLQKSWLLAVHIIDVFCGYMIKAISIST